MTLFIQTISQERMNFLKKLHDQAGGYKPSDVFGRIVILKQGYKANGKPLVPMNSIGRVVDQNSTQLLLVANGPNDNAKSERVVVPKDHVIYGIAPDEHCPCPALGNRNSSPPVPARSCQITTAYKTAHASIPKGSMGTLSTIASDYLSVQVDVQVGGNKTRTVILPSSIVSVMAPPDAANGVGRVVRLRTKTHDPGGNSYDAHKLGTVTKVHEGGCYISVRFYDSNETLDRVPGWLWEYGPFSDRWSVNFGRNPAIPSSSKLEAEIEKSSDYPSTTLWCVVYQILAEIWKERASTTGLSDAHLQMFNTEDKAKVFAKMIHSGTFPGVRQVLESSNGFNFDQVFAAGKVIRKDLPNNTPGYYQRRYSKFKMGEFQGNKPKHYGGHTKDQNVRDSGHNNDKTDTTKNGHHVRVKRAAQKTEVVQLFELPQQWRTQDEKMQRRRLEIVEQVFFLLLKMYSPKVVNYEVVAQFTEAASVEDYVASSYLAREVATNLSKIAQTALKTVGWSGANKSSFFNTGEEGLNIQSPLESWSGDMYEKVLWTKTTVVTQHGNMNVFRRSTSTFLSAQKGGHGYECCVMTVAKRSFAADLTHIQKYGPPPNTKGWVQIECMENGQHHACPYIRAPYGHPWSNLDEVLGVGVQFLWYENGTLMQRYITSPAQGRTTIQDDSAEPTAFPMVRAVTDLRAFLMHQTIIKPPPGLPELGLARVLETRIDQFRRKITARYVTGPATPVTMTLDPARSIQAMRDAGLHRIGGTFGSIDWSGFRHKKYITGKLASASPNTMNRTSCDRCYLQLRLVTPISCEQVQNSDRCKNCKDRNMDCSWTSSDQLLGDFFEKQGQLSDAQREIERGATTGSLAQARNALLLLTTDLFDDLVKKKLAPEGTGLPVERVADDVEEDSAEE